MLIKYNFFLYKVCSNWSVYEILELNYFTKNPRMFADKLNLSDNLKKNYF